MASTSYKLTSVISTLLKRMSHFKPPATHNHGLTYQPVVSSKRCWSSDKHLDNDCHVSNLEKSSSTVEGTRSEELQNVQDINSENGKAKDNLVDSSSILKSSDVGQSNSIKANKKLTSSQGKDTVDEDEAAKKKKKAPVSEMLKVIRHKKMLEIYQRRRPKSKSANVPVVGVNPGFKNQLQEYISRHEDTFESNSDRNQQFAVSKTGKVLMFPLYKSDGGFEDNSISSLNDSGEKLPSVTSILNVTRPMKQAMALLRWEKRMIKELGIDGFQKMKEEMFGEGHEVHRALEHYLQGSSVDDLELSSGIQGYWHSCRDILQRINNPAGFQMRVIHPAMQYTGFLDCVAEVNGKVSLIEWKTSRKLKQNLDQNEEYPLQAVAYLGAMNFDSNHQNIQVEQVVIVVMYKDGHEATVHYLDEEACSHYWTKWLGRLLEHHEIAEMKKWYIRGKIIEWNRTKKAATANSAVDV